MHLELVSIPTSSTPLDGLFYSPAPAAEHHALQTDHERHHTNQTNQAALLFHGNTMNFYTGSLKFLPPALISRNISCLAFNRRGHDILAIRNSRAAEGAAFQSAAQAIDDNAIAADWLRGKGFPSPIVIGHSNGGMLAVKHVATRPETPALILLSAHCGGKNMVPRASAAGLLARERLDEITAQATTLVAQGRGKELILLPGWWYVISAESFLDQLSGLPDILTLAPSINCPVLYIRGDQEPRDLYPAEDFAARCAGPCDVEIIGNCDHFYNGVEQRVATLVSTWLKDTLSL